MGRVKLKIKRLESSTNRQVTYSKRRNGILKKARELSILCDIDIVLLLFSPTGRSTLFHGQRSNIEEVIARFAQLTPQERAKRKLESLEALKKAFKKLDHDVNIQDFLGASNQTVEELTRQLRILQAQLMEVHQRLSYWSNPGNIDSMEHLRQMENSLRESINQIRVHKENFGKQQHMSLEFASQLENSSTSAGCPLSLSLSYAQAYESEILYALILPQLQGGMHLPLMMNGVQENQPISWLPNNDNQHMLVPDDPKFLPQRNMGCSEDAPIRGYSGFLDTGKDIEVGNSGQADNMGQGGGNLNVLSNSACLRLQLGEQYSYPPYCSLSLPNDKMLKPDVEMNLQGNPAVYQVNSNFELSRPIYGNGNHDWVPASGPCGIAMFDENSYHQQTNQLS